MLHIIYSRTYYFQQGFKQHLTQGSWQAFPLRIWSIICSMNHHWWRKNDSVVKDLFPQSLLTENLRIFTAEWSHINSFLPELELSLTTLLNKHSLPGILYNSVGRDGKIISNDVKMSMILWEAIAKTGFEKFSVGVWVGGQPEVSLRSKDASYAGWIPRSQEMIFLRFLKLDENLSFSCMLRIREIRKSFIRPMEFQGRFWNI